MNPTLKKNIIPIFILSIALGITGVIIYLEISNENSDPKIIFIESVYAETTHFKLEIIFVHYEGDTTACYFGILNDNYIPNEWNLKATKENGTLINVSAERTGLGAYSSLIIHFTKLDYASWTFTDYTTNDVILLYKQDIVNVSTPKLEIFSDKKIL